MVYWKRWAAKQDCEELKESSVSVAYPSFAAKEDPRRVDRHAPQCVDEIGRRNAKKFGRHRFAKRGHVEDVTKEEGIEKHRQYLCPSWRDLRNQIPEGLGKRELRAHTSNDHWKWRRRITAAASA